MSWSAGSIGTKEAVAKDFAEQMDRCAAMYTGKDEEKMVLVCKERGLFAIENALVGEGLNGVKIDASGSEWQDSEGRVRSMNFSLNFQLVKLAT